MPKDSKSNTAGKRPGAAQRVTLRDCCHDQGPGARGVQGKEQEMRAAVKGLGGCTKKSGSWDFRVSGG